MEYQIRKIQEEEYGLLKEFLYLAIYVPEGTQPPPRSILLQPELQVYLKDFGREKDDHGVIAWIQDKAVGAAWARVMNDYGHIDNQTPSLALAVSAPFRGQGIGTALLKRLLDDLRKTGYDSVSLSVQRANPALRLYQCLGFEEVFKPVSESQDEIILRCLLQPDQCLFR